MTRPGWYIDPEDPDHERYWNGGSWQRDTRPLTGAAAFESRASVYVGSSCAAASHTPTWLMPVAAIAALCGAVLLAVGLFLGYGTISSDGINCGSAFGGASQNGLVQDYANAMEGYGLTNVAGDCESAVSSRHTVANALTWPGGVLLVGSLIASGVTYAAKRR